MPEAMLMTACRPERAGRQAHSDDNERMSTALRRTDEATTRFQGGAASDVNEVRAGS